MPTRAAPRTSRGRAGYGPGALVNAALLWAINVWPGWQAAPFLTPDTTRVLGLVNAFLAVSIVANLVFLVARSRAIRALGDLVVLGFGLAAMIAVWEVFPFDFSHGWSGWTVLVRILLVLGIAGQIIGAIVELVALARTPRAP